MYTPHIVTVVNMIVGDDYTATYEATVLSGVFLDTTASRGASNSAQTSPQDTATLYIPFNVEAYSAKTGSVQVYVKPHAYEQKADKSGFWTLREASDSSATPCWFAKGIAAADEYAEMRKNGDCWAVTAVRTLDFGSDGMQHWAVSGR